MIEAQTFSFDSRRFQKLQTFVDPPPFQRLKNNKKKSTTEFKTQDYFLYLVDDCLKS